ncbi:hypothetical protein Dimus_034313 [Dionaea muscipula]
MELTMVEQYLCFAGECTIAISASNTGGSSSWDNAKKYIEGFMRPQDPVIPTYVNLSWFSCEHYMASEAEASEHARQLGPKGSDAHKAAVIGDTVGDPLKARQAPLRIILGN